MYILCSVYIGETVKTTTRRSLALTAIFGVISSFLLVIAPAQSASAAFRPVSSGGLSITSIANQQVMTDPVTGARNYMAGMPGDKLAVQGSGFLAGPITVTFLGQNAPVAVTPVVPLSDTDLEVVVPAGATTGFISISDEVNTVTSADAFQIWSARSEAYVMPDGHLNISLSDLTFILDQIKFSEAFAKRTATTLNTNQTANVVSPYDQTQCLSAADLTAAKNLQLYGATGLSNAYIYDAISPWGLRQVDGRCNNITTDANGNFIKRDLGATDQLFSRIEPQTNGSLYSNNGNTVTDTSPRVISNLIADQTDKNPAAVSAAQDTAAILGTSVTHSNSVNATTGAISTVLDIPNVTADYNTSAGYNSLFTLFGQFFDHGLDLIPKGDPAYVLIPLERTDPLYVPGGNTNFMILTRGVSTGGAVPAGESMNITTPYIDQSQAYGSHPSQNFFLREYSFAATTGLPTLTGNLLSGTDGAYSAVASPSLNASYPAGVASASLPSAWVSGGSRNFANSGTLAVTNGGLPTWRDIKAQAFLLGFRLTDYDASNIPVVATDQFGVYVPCSAGGVSNGFPMMLFRGSNNMYRWVCGNPTAPIATSFDEGGFTWNSVNTNHNFINDTANNGVPMSGNTKLNADADSVINSAKAEAMVPGYYDNESLDSHYVAGDGRVNENIGLAAIHGTFKSEHNLVVQDLKDLLLKNPQVSKEFFSEWNLVGGSLATPHWNGSRLFAAARYVVETEYQHMAFDEFARRFSPSLAGFVGYNPALDPNITAEFGSSVYRLGHSMLNETIARSVPGQYYSTTNNQDLSLIDAFTSPTGFRVQKPITVLSGQTHANQTITYTVLSSAATLSPAVGQVVTITGFASNSHLNVVSAVVSASTVDTFTISSRYEGGSTATPTAFTGLTDGLLTGGLTAADGTYVSIATINDAMGQYSYSPASATAAIVQGMSSQRGNEVDEFVTDAVRTNLLGLPLDLAALNIARGRDTLLPTLNQFREYLRLTNKAPVAGYSSWMAFGNKMRHFDSLTNFIAAYGTHPTITTKRLGAIISVASTEASHSITYTTASALADVINVGDVVSISGLATTAFNKNWAHVSAVSGNTFTIDGTFATDPEAATSLDTATAMGIFMSPPARATALSGIVDSATAADAGFVTRRTNIAERRTAAELLVPSDIKSATMSQTSTGTDPVVVATTITYDATNAFKVGDVVSVQGAMPLVFNQTGVVVVAATTTSFTVSVVENPTVEAYFMGGRATLTTRQADADAFIYSTTSPSAPTTCDYPAGPSACINWAGTETGMNYVDLWMGGLAEAPITQPISPQVLPATFDYVFNEQMLNLQNGDRLYYISRLTGTNLLDEIAAQKLADIILRNVPSKSGVLPNSAVAAGSHATLKATSNFIFGISDCIVDGASYTPSNPGCPNTWLDTTTNTITHTPLVLNTIMVTDENCINGQTPSTYRLTAGGGDDVVWGGKCKDFLRGGIGGDMVKGLGGDDILFGEGGDDLVQGGPGNDFLDTGDNVVGDLADGGSGKDFVSAGAGKGVFFFSGETGDDFLIDGSTTPAPFNGGEGNDWVQDGVNTGIGAVSTGDSGPNVQLNNILDGGADVIYTGGGNDTADGGSGNDLYLAGDGIDLNVGGEGFDFVSYEYRNQTQDIFADLSGLLAAPITILPDGFLAIEGLSGSSGNDLLSSDTTPDLTLTNVSGTLGGDLIYIPVNNTSIRVNQQISGPGIPAHTVIIALPALVPNVLTPTYSIALSNTLTQTFTNANVQVHGWSITSPEYINGLSSQLSASPGWNKVIPNVTVSGYTQTLGTSSGNYLLLDRAIDWISVGSTVSIGGNALVDTNGDVITVTGVYGESVSLSATPTVIPGVFPTTASFTPNGTFSGGNIMFGGAGDDILYSQGGDNVIDGEAYVHTCIAVTNADGSAFETGADVPCGAGLGYSSLHLLNDYAGQGIINSGNMNIVREIKSPATPCGYTCNTLVYSGLQNQYTITPMVNPMGDIQYLQITKPDGVDIVRNVKTIQFGNPTINFLDPFAAMWNGLCTGGVACITLSSNYPPISSTCLSVCPAPNVNSFAPPTVASVAPAGGGAGTLVTITGTNFRTVGGGTTVTFNGVQATDVTVLDTMTLTCRTPVNVTTGPIVVTTLGGSATSPTSFTVVPAPTITKLSVVTGTSGTAVTVTGTNLTYLVSVDVNGAPALVRTKTATTIGITVPNNASTGAVHVITTSGTATSANFTVKPTITTLTPATGARLSSVTITGTNFTGTTAVTVGGIAVASGNIRVVSPTSLMITVPNTAITGRVVVTNAGGTATSAANYTVVIPPAFNGANPFCVSSAATAPVPCTTSGPAGSVVTAYGTTLTGSSLVKIGNVVAPIAAVTGSTAVRFTIPTGAPLGAQRIAITTPGGTITSATSFTVTNPAPTISTFTANTGGGFTTVKINGTNFTGVTAVKFGGSAGTTASYKVINSTLIIADAPAGLATASHAIYVAAAGGSVTSGSTFAKTAGTAAAPTIASISPSLGSVGSTVTITVPGTSYLASLVAVKFGAVTAPFTITSATSILTAVPAGATTNNITLVYPGSVVSNGASFTVSGATAAPTLTTFSPNQASIGATITASGTNLAGTTGVSFKGIPVSYKVNSATSISFVVPVGATTGTLTVVTTGGSTTSTSTVSIL